MDRKNLVTIIIPVYNVEKYLNRCIESIVQQTYRNLEIILVDDGSPDRCPEICDAWAQKDYRIKVIHKKNAGLGMARNTGIENGTGEYVLFVDSDDYISLNAVEKIMTIAERTGADLLQFGSYTVNRNGAIEKDSVPTTEKAVYKNEEVTNIILPNMIASDLCGTNMNLAFGAWSKAYRMDLIRKSNWRFVSERELISEDYYSILCLMKDVQRIAIVHEALYYYCMNENSLSHAYRTDRFAQQNRLYNACIKVCEEFGYSQEVKERLGHMYMNGIIGVMRMYYVANISTKTKKQTIREIICDNELQQIVHCMDINREKAKKRMLYFAIRQKWASIVYFLIWSKYGRSR